MFGAPARGSFGTRVHDLRRRGGHVGFAVDGDLYVADSFGRMVWSLEEEVEREREGGGQGNKSGGGEGQGREDDILLVH